MILQCEQCNTKFRLDDSKLKPGGVKVRCSKCRHVFVAGAEPAPETDFDAILSGLGASAPQPQETVAPVAAAAGTASLAPSAEAFPGAEGEEESAPPQTQAPAAPQAPAPEAESSDFGLPDSDDFSFEDEPLAQAPVPRAQEAGVFGEISFDLQSAEQQAAEEPAGAGGSLAFGEFSFDEEEPAPVAAPASEPAAKESALFGEFSFDEELPGKTEPLPQGDDMAGLSEFSFDQEPVTGGGGRAPVSEDSLGFGEFSFDAEPEEEIAQPAAAPKEDLLSKDFAFDHEPEGKGEPAASDLDFGDFSFEEKAPQPPKESAGTAEDDALLFSDEPEEQVPAAPGGVPAASFSFDDDRVPPAKSATGFGSFSFADDLAEEHDSAFTAKGAPVEPEIPAWVGTAAAAPAGAVPGAALFPGAEGAAMPSFDGDEELPPLSISSRRKGRSLAALSFMGVSLLLLAGLGGAGYYLSKNGTAALNKIGLGSVAHWFGVESPDEGRITINNPVAAFHQNKEAGELFVVTGSAQNQFSKPRASIHVRVTLFDKSGKTLLQKTAYCGNRLSDDQLSTLPMAKIEAAMNNQFGDSLANLGVQPGNKIPFVVAIANAPKEAADFGVDVIGSTVAGQ